MKVQYIDIQWQQCVAHEKQKVVSEMAIMKKWYMETWYMEKWYMEKIKIIKGAVPKQE